MISQVPTADEYYAAAMRSFGMAFGLARGPISKEIEVGPFDSTTGNDTADLSKIRVAAGPILAHCYVLLMQGLELGLKARVSEISPYLLVDTHQGVRGQTDEPDVPFSDFLTVPAHKLPALHDLVHPQRLHKSFGKFYNSIRDRRNRIVHSVGGGQPVAPSKVAIDVVKSYNYVFMDDRFLIRLYEYNSSDVLNFTGVYGDWIAETCSVAVYLLDGMTPNEARRLLGFPVGGQRVICGRCMNGHSKFGPRENARVAIRTSRDIAHCRVCDATIAVYTRDCSNTSCDSNTFVQNSWGEVVCDQCDTEMTSSVD